MYYSLHDNRDVTSKLLTKHIILQGWTMYYFGLIALINLTIKASTMNKQNKKETQQDLLFSDVYNA